MDKETIGLVEGVRKLLTGYEETVQGSVLKKTRKVTSQIIWSAEEYLDELDNIRSSSKTDEEAIQRIRSLVRRSEEDALKSMTVHADDTGHHLVQSRTGGDALTRVPYERSSRIIQDLGKEFDRTFGNTMGPRGNLPPEMSLSNFAHKADDRATGLERESGLGKNPDKATTAHAKGTAGYADMKGVDMTDDEAIKANLRGKVGEQIRQGEIAAQTDAPRQQFLREASGRPELYKGPVPGDLELDRQAILRSYDTLRPGLRNAAKFLNRIPAGPAKAAGAVITAGMTLSDAAQAAEGTQTAVKAESPRERVKGTLQATSGALGVASVAAPNPLTVGGSAITGFLGGVMEHFDQKRGRRRRDSALQTGIETSTAAEVPAQITQYNRTPNRYERRNR